MNILKIRISTLGKLEKILFYGFLAVAILFFVVYLFYMKQSLTNIVVHNQTREKIGQLGTVVASLETEYLSLSGRQITPDYALAMGFRDISTEQSYVVSNNKTVTLSLVNNEF